MFVSSLSKFSAHLFVDRASVRDFKQAAKKSIQKVLFAEDLAQGRSAEKQSKTSYPVIREHDSADTLVFPLVQAGPFGIDVDHRVTASFLERCEAGSQVTLASAYFNLTPSYIKTILQSKATHRIYTASPQVCVAELKALLVGFVAK